jgi:TPP-dependent pyruvate/acetoin dehydrogenase alpha subunit
MMDIQLALRLYHQLFRIRKVEQKIARVYPSDVIKSPVHLSIGQEAISVGVCDVLRREDVVFGTYRGHALYMAKGGNLNAMMAELYGKVDGCCRGKGGSMHLLDSSVNMMQTSAVVATSIPQAVGYAMSIKYRSSDKVVVCFFGDGATNEGAFYESINFASLKQLPILFVCENNGYAIHSSVRSRSAQTEIYKIAKANKIESYVIEDNDVFKIRTLAKNLINEIRSGGGPRFLEAYTYRCLEHVGPSEDWDMNYRSIMEMDTWNQQDQVEVLGNKLPVDEKNAIEKNVKHEISLAFEFAEKSAFPDQSELEKHVYG